MTLDDWMRLEEVLEEVGRGWKRLKEAEKG